MLQQTQVSRVIPKFEAFITSFPDERSLAEADLADVVRAWQGLGYNRRAKFLHQAAKMITHDFSGIFPTEGRRILSLPGVGRNTLGAIEAYAFDRPSLFVETNIRTVYIHHFFADDFDVDDQRIIEKLDRTLDRDHVRDFYWALMDYGSWLKSSGVRNIDRSRHYKKQSSLEGSVRQVRGLILRELSGGDSSERSLREAVSADGRFGPALAGLERDGLITISAGLIHLTK